MRMMAFAAVCAALMLGAAPAMAGECPPDQVGVDVMAPGPSETHGVTVEPLAQAELAEQYGIEGRTLRLRRVVFAPGAQFGWHDHATRPGVLAIVSGEMTEYRSTCAVPIMHRAGEGTAEAGPIFHWWKNNGAEPAVAIAADLPEQE